MTQTKYPLPAIVDPPERLCIQINIPDEPGHRAAFAGAIYNLTKWYSWKEDSAQTAKAVAAVWRGVWDELQDNFYDGCEGIEMGCDVRQNAEAPCILEKDCGDGWVPFANLQACPPNIRLVGGVPEWFNPVTNEWEPTAGGTQAPKPAPRPEGSAPEQKCAAAANAAEVFRALHSQMAALVTDPTNTPLQATAFLVAIIASLFIIPVLVAALLAGVIAIMALSYAWDTADFDLIIDDLICIFYCNAEAGGDGRVTFDYAGVLSEVTAKASGSGSAEELIMWSLIGYYLGWVGGDGLNIAGGTQAGATYDCGECPCVEECEDCIAEPVYAVKYSSSRFTYTGATTTGSIAGRPSLIMDGTKLYFDLQEEVCLYSVRFVVYRSVANIEWLGMLLKVDGVEVGARPLTSSTGWKNVDWNFYAPPYTGYPKGSVISLELNPGQTGSRIIIDEVQIRTCE